jgi:enoyl-CoA hydratase
MISNLCLIWSGAFTGFFRPRVDRETLYRRPNTSKPAPGHKIHSCLLRNLPVTRPNQVWAMDITYIPMARGFVYLVAVADWFSRRVVSWRLSITLEADFCIQAVEEALARYGKPDIFNTGHGSQFNSIDFIKMLRDDEIALSVDRNAAWRGNFLVERLWRAIKYEDVYLHAYASVPEARAVLSRYLTLTMPDVLIHCLTGRPRIRPTSTRRGQIRLRQNRGGNPLTKPRQAVQTNAATSLCRGSIHVEEGMVPIVEGEITNGVSWITLNRPKKLNALAVEMVQAAHALVKQCEANDEVRVIVITGAGGQFSVGFDIAEEVEARIAKPEDWHAQLSRNFGLSMVVWSCLKPTVAVVDGWCLAGACGLAMACDLIVVTDRVKFGEPETRFGSGPVTLPMLFVLGQKKTTELLLTGDAVNAREAECISLINQVVAVDKLEASVQQFAEKIALTSLVTLHFTKIAITRACEATGLRNAVNANLDIAATLNAAYAPEKAQFDELVDTRGLGEALNWRDSRYGAIDKTTNQPTH